MYKDMNAAILSVTNHVCIQNDKIPILRILLLSFWIFWMSNEM